MSDGLHIPCPHCDKLNRVPPGRRAEEGKCGHCKLALFAGEPLVLTTKRFDAHAGARDLPLLVDFWAEWCGPCRTMAPTFAAAARKFEPRVRFAKVNTDEERRLAAKFDIRSIPTMILFRAGQPAGRISGALPAGELDRWVEAHLATA